MVVLSVTNCPSQLRGDLTKWFIEIDVGVYVGKLSARVRDKIWSRVCDNIKSGKAIMVYSTNSEQGFAIVTHNTEWNPVDCDGIWLMQKLNTAKSTQLQSVQRGFSKASRYAKIRSRHKKEIHYVILDIETTGLDYESDRIIEIGMIKVCGRELEDQYQNFILCDKPIPQKISSMTGITLDMIKSDGINEQQAIREMKKFIGDSVVVGYNVEFDIKFIEKMCERQCQDNFIFKCKDVLKMVKRKIYLDNYKLETVARACEVEIISLHRALEDCKLIYGINNKLNIF